MFLKERMRSCVEVEPYRLGCAKARDKSTTLANVAPIADLDKVASTCGGYGIVLVSIFQGRFDAQANRVAVYFKDGNNNVVPNDDASINSPCEDKHGASLRVEQCQCS